MFNLRVVFQFKKLFPLVVSQSGGEIERPVKGNWEGSCRANISPGLRKWSTAASRISAVYTARGSTLVHRLQ